jgi:hypothetical protein
VFFFWWMELQPFTKIGDIILNWSVFSLTEISRNMDEISKIEPFMFIQKFDSTLTKFRFFKIGRIRSINWSILAKCCIM